MWSLNSRAVTLRGFRRPLGLVSEVFAEPLEVLSQVGGLAVLFFVSLGGVFSFLSLLTSSSADLTKFLEELG
jgi:hypothetical protein